MLGRPQPCSNTVHIPTSLKTKNEFCLGEKTHPKGPHLRVHPCTKNAPNQKAGVPLMGKMIADVPWGLLPEAWVSCRKLVLQRYSALQSQLLAFN